MRRVMHFTFHKCGSQWVRDVLTAPEVVAVTGCPLHVLDPDGDRPWPDQPPGTFAGPLYDATRQDWERLAGPDDRAVVVLRDPRDRAVSLAYSLALSHAYSPLHELAQPLVMALTPALRLRYALLGTVPVAAAMRSWVADDHDPRVRVARYEALVADPRGAFAELVDHLGWVLPPGALDQALQRYSFEARSGRRPGETDPHSHYRRGVAGDWRNHIDRPLGAQIEAVFPGLLVALGYEQESAWYEDLPASIAPDAVPDVQAPGWVQLRVEMARARERVLELERACAERDACISDLEQTAQERLELVEYLADRPWHRRLRCWLGGRTPTPMPQAAG